MKGRLAALTGVALMVAACQPEPSTDQPIDTNVGTGIDRPLAVEATQEAADKPLLSAVGRTNLITAFTSAADLPRTFQRGLRAYSHTIRERDAEEIKGRDYRLSVNGRVTGFPDGQPIHCWNESPDLRSVCFMAVELARIAFEDSPAGNVLVEWRN